MRCQRLQPLGRLRWSGLVLALLAACLPNTAAASDLDPVRVEEDWELVLNQPNAEIHSPQLTLFMFPSQSNDNMYFQLQLNHAATADYAGGGYQVTAVADGIPLDFVRSSIRQPFRQDQGLVVWTTVMANMNGEILFAVKDGLADDWGAFGGPEYLVRMPAGGLTSLNDYSPLQTIEAVDVGFGANRVASLVLKRVRLYYPNGQVVSLTVNLSP